VNNALFPAAEYWWFYVGFVGVVVLLLGIDLGLFQRKAHAPSVKEAALWSLLWVSLSLIFNYFLFHFSFSEFAHSQRLQAMPNFNADASAKQVALEFLTGYIVEQSLSIDNLFVFVIIFNYFAIPTKLQHRILFFGILGAFLFRGLFIGVGSLLVQFQAVVVIFGAFLVLTGAKIFFSSEDKLIQPEKNHVIRWLKKFLPVSADITKGKFFIRQQGTLHATPLFLALVMIEVSDIIFAVDSVPAIFAITREPLVVFTSNICAILGLRSMYFLLVHVVEKFYLLKYGLGIVLVFVGLKMSVLHYVYPGHFPIALSLGIIVAVVGGSVIFSLLFPKR